MFAEIKNNVIVTWPYDYDTLCRANPNTAFPSNMTLQEMYIGTQANVEGHELVKVAEQAQPAFDVKTQFVTLASQPTLVNEKWEIGWTVSTYTQDEQSVANQQKSSSVREQRNQKLKDTDWTQLADSQVEKSAWATYRQALRDVPKQSGFPWEVTWPDAP